VERILVEKRNDADIFTALTVFGKDGSKQLVLQSVDPNKKFTAGAGSFSGYYGVAGFQNEKLTALYLGKGTEMAQSGYSIQSKIPEGSANLILEGKTIRINCNQETEVGLPEKNVKKAFLQLGSVQNELKITKTEKGILLTLPAIENGVILLK